MPPLELKRRDDDVPGTISPDIGNSSNYQQLEKHVGGDYEHVVAPF
jgi:hypothetical protein